MPAVRSLIIVLGDQLDTHSSALTGGDPEHDAILMMEVAHESTKVWSTKPRIAVFLAAMRHFREAMRAKGWRVHYRELTATSGHWHSAAGKMKPSPSEDFSSVLAEAIRSLKPQRLVIVEPGEWSVRDALRQLAAAHSLPLDEREDTHFLCTRADFAAHCEGRKQLRMEFFYREMRQKYKVLMDGKQPAGGAWNFDSENRKSFGKAGPPIHHPPLRFPPDALTAAVITVVNTRFADHPGDLARFDWPVTPAEAQDALKDFITHRLAAFGDWQDAMWTAEPWLFHSRLSAAMNLKLLDPRTVIAAAEEAWEAGHIPLPAAEGFIRQILGWREYVRGIYWHFMPGYVELNALEAHEPLPAFYWTGETDMACLRDSLHQTLTLGYAHHIQRLMVTGLYALLYGVTPKAVHEWYLAVYVDAVEWVELPNTLGMSQHGDGGIMASKPYAATGKYIQRMSNYCTGCRYDPAQSTGPAACPFTTLYWDFLIRHRPLLSKNQRMSLQLKNIDRLSSETQSAIRTQAQAHRAAINSP